VVETGSLNHLLLVDPVLLSQVRSTWALLGVLPLLPPVCLLCDSRL
jgi:hypothetical protein